MVDVINGGVYAVDLGGTEAYEFKDVHPALVIRTLFKEKRKIKAEQAEYTRAKISGVSIEQQRQNDENSFLERIGKLKKRDF